MCVAMESVTFSHIGQPLTHLNLYHCGVSSSRYQCLCNLWLTPPHCLMSGCKVVLIVAHRVLLLASHNIALSPPEGEGENSCKTKYFKGAESWAFEPFLNLKGFSTKLPKPSSDNGVPQQGLTLLSLCGDLQSRGNRDTM